MATEQELPGKNGFRYDPLEKPVGCLRLVTIQPSLDSSADIECIIINGEIKPGEYNALSYTWGDANDKKSITLNGHSVDVTHNLFIALQHLREAKEPLTLWIDAICINQNDIDERNQQVKQMIEIYRNAKQVIIWMGEDIEKLDEAICLINWIKSVMTSHLWEVENLVDFAGSPHRMEGWAALTELLNRPWWSRVWIIQEVVFGNDPVVVCGKERFSWDLLQRLAESRETWNKITWSLYEAGKPFYTGQFVHASDRLNFIGALRAAHPIGTESLRALLCGVRTSEATDPRDKVFAMLGLLGTDVSLCEVDYHKSVGQVYAEAAAGIFKLTKSLHFLSWTHNSTSRSTHINRPDGIPSWAPSWIGTTAKAPDSEKLGGKTIEDLGNSLLGLLNGGDDDHGLLELQQFDDSMSMKHRKLYSEEIRAAAKASTNKTVFEIDIANRMFFGNTKPSPNWVSLFQATDPQLPISSLSISKKSLYSVTEDSRHFAYFNTEKRSLTVLAFAIDTLEDVSPVCYRAPGVDFPLDGAAGSWIRSVLNAKLGLPTSDWSDSDDADSEDHSEIAIQLEPAFWRTLLADQWQGARLKKALPLEIPGIGSIPPKSVEDLFEIRRAVMSLENQPAFSWRTLYTSAYTIGLTPPTAQIGDELIGILGCDVPYLVRKCDGGYKLLGECYIDGLMDGAIMEGGYFTPFMLELV